MQEKAAWVNGLSIMTKYSFQVHPHLSINKKKVKSTLVEALRLCTGRTAHRGSRGIVLPFLDHGTRRG